MGNKLLLEMLTGHGILVLAGTWILINDKRVCRSNVTQMLENGGRQSPVFQIDCVCAKHLV